MPILGTYLAVGSSEAATSEVSVLSLSSACNDLLPLLRICVRSIPLQRQWCRLQRRDGALAKQNFTGQIIVALIRGLTP
jgi:hypothetical protein